MNFDEKGKEGFAAGIFIETCSWAPSNCLFCGKCSAVFVTLLAALKQEVYGVREDMVAVDGAAKSD